MIIRKSPWLEHQVRPKSFDFYSHILDLWRIFFCFFPFKAFQDKLKKWFAVRHSAHVCTLLSQAPCSLSWIHLLGEKIGYSSYTWRYDQFRCYPQGLLSVSGEQPLNQFLLMECVSIPFSLAGLRAWQNALVFGRRTVFLPQTLWGPTFTRATWGCELNARHTVSDSYWKRIKTISLLNCRWTQHPYGKWWVLLNTSV